MAQRLFFRCDIGIKKTRDASYEIRAFLTRQSDTEWALEATIKGLNPGNFREEHGQAPVVIQTPEDSARLAKQAAIEHLQLMAAQFLKVEISGLNKALFRENWIDRSD